MNGTGHSQASCTQCECFGFMCRFCAITGLRASVPIHFPYLRTAEIFAPIVLLKKSRTRRSHNTCCQYQSDRGFFCFCKLPTTTWFCPRRCSFSSCVPRHVSDAPLHILVSSLILMIGRMRFRKVWDACCVAFRPRLEVF